MTLIQLSRVHLLAVTACLLGTLLNLSTVQAQEKQRPPEESCADGYYTGPRVGRKNYSHDKYIWVVTPEFAQRFCMPPEYVDKALKGAEAIAFRMSTQTGLFDRCAIIEGKEKCAGDQELRFDIFLRSDLNLPAANPDVKFYDGSRDDAGWHIARFGPGKSMKPPGDRYRSGEYQPPPGAVPHFENPFYHPDMGNHFGLIGVNQDRGFAITSLKEWSYRANWADGLDLVVLQSHPSFGFQNPRIQTLGIRQFVIVLDKRMDTRKDSEKRVPEDYAHVIRLPEKFFEKVRKAATTRGQSWAELLHILRQR
ncbi:MAG: hypothetical protein EPN55_05430 [Gammaproteobacteria bacterium]|nr:MAG: hypothetical protein EPN55_05430 [Gammaproteobacteria bacterium]